MGGTSSVFQTLWSGWSAASQSATQTNLANIIPFAVSLLSGAIMLLVLATGKNMMFGEVRLGEAVTRGVRALVITALLTAGAFNTYVTTPLTQTIPNAISSAVSGGQSTAGAAAWDALNDATTSAAAHARAQMVPSLFYAGDRAALWLIELATKGLNALCFLVWAVATSVVYFALPVIALMAPAWLFDRTRGWAERAIGFVLGLVLTQALTLMVSATAISLERQFFAQYSTAVTSPATTNQNFATNGGNVVWTEFGPVNTTTGQVASGAGAVASTVNTDAANEALMNMFITVLFGFFVLGATSTIAFLIAASSGFSAGSIVGGVTYVVQRAASGANKAGRRLRA